MRLSAFIICVFAKAVCSHRGGSCAIDTVMKSSDYYVYNSRISYTKGRALGSDQTFLPIRISSTFHDVDNTSPDAYNLVMSSLMPDAIEWLSKSLLTRSVAGNLSAVKVCTDAFSNGVCRTAVSQTCGHVAIPDEYSQPMQVCSECNSSGCSGCEMTPGGAGIPNTDFHVLVTAYQSSYCTDGVLAYAATCQRDQFDRPIFGFANFCPQMLSTAADDYPQQSATALHELFHAIGFSSASWPLYRDENNLPRSPRDSEGHAIWNASADCIGRGTKGNWVISENTIRVSSKRGTTVVEMSTPRVASIARDIFDCDTLTGAELENQPTSSSCFASHWEQRNFMNELMAPIATHNTITSALTLAALEDSGWYRANYSHVGTLRWGSNKGCQFLSEPCIHAGGNALSDEFCTTGQDLSTGAWPDSSVGCTSDYMAKGYCDKMRHSQTVSFQYFDDPQVGGSVSTADFCPHFRSWSNGACTLPGNVPVNNVFSEIYASSSRCFPVVHISTTPWEVCYPMRCSEGNLEVSVAKVGGDRVWVQCSIGEILGVNELPLGGPISSLTCPKIDLCTNSCPSACANTTFCNNGVCTCGAAFGIDCTSVELSTPTPSAPEFSPPTPPNPSPPSISQVQPPVSSIPLSVPPPPKMWPPWPPLGAPLTPMAPFTPPPFAPPSGNATIGIVIIIIVLLLLVTGITLYMRARSKRSHGEVKSNSPL